MCSLSENSFFQFKLILQNKEKHTYFSILMILMSFKENNYSQYHSKCTFVVSRYCLNIFSMQ